MSATLSKKRRAAREAPSPSRGASSRADDRARALERKLAEASARLKDLIDISTDWIWETDENLRFTAFSGRLAEVSGVDPSTLIGKTRGDIMDPSLSDEQRRRHSEDLRARRPFRDFTYRIQTPKGLRYFKVSGNPQFDESGRFSGYRGTGSDITGEIEANRRAQAIQTRFIEAIECIPASLMLHDAEDRLVLCNTITRSFFPGLENLLKPGIPFEDLIRAQVKNGVLPSAVPDPEGWIAERLRVHRDPSGGAITRQHTNGRWVQIIERKTSDGGIIGIRLDVTELKTQERALARKTELLQATLDNISQGLSAYDGDLRLIAFNRRYLEVMQFPAEFGALGRPFQDFTRHCALRGDYGPGDPEVHVAQRVSLVCGGEHALERTIPGGTVIEIRGRPLPGGGFVATYTDITERKRQAEALEANALRLEEAARELKQSNTELEQFAYIASHDLQEPLRMVGSYCQLLQRRYKGKLDKDADEFIGFAVEGATRMQRMINDLLAYSRVGRSGKGFAPVPLGEVVRAAVANVQIAIEESGAQVRWKDLPTVEGEKSQLLQVFQNLIGNAIKFRGDRVPEIDIAARKDGEDWHLSVRDNGIGIEPQYVERIFLIFQRLHDRSKYDGTGIGLAVCKKVVEQHGGRIWVESAPGQGSTFHFTLQESYTGKETS